MNEITIPEYCLVLMVGPSGSGKSTFARKHFLPTEVVSSDYCRGVVSDDENDQGATKAAFELLHFIVEKRLQARRLTVVDATNVRPEDRAALVKIAKTYHALTAAFVFLVPEDVCQVAQCRTPGPSIRQPRRAQSDPSLAAWPEAHENRGHSLSVSPEQRRRGQRRHDRAAKTVDRQAARNRRLRYYRRRARLRR